MPIKDKTNSDPGKGNGLDNINSKDILEIEGSRNVEVHAYVDTDRKLHWLSQVIAKTNQTYVPDKPDHSHINLYFDALANRIDGRWIDNGRERVMLTINLFNLNLEWLNSHREVTLTIETVGKTMDEIEAELINSYSEVGLRKGHYAKELYYEIPEYGYTKVKPLKSKHLRQWRMHRRLANNLCTLVLGYLDIQGEIRISPKFFNTNIFSVFNDQVEFKFGLAMENSVIGCPYFYITGHPIHGHFEYDDVPDMLVGKWIIGEHWKGAVLPICDLKSGKYDKNKGKINDFLIASIDWHTRSHVLI